LSGLLTCNQVWRVSPWLQDDGCEENVRGERGSWVHPPAPYQFFLFPCIRLDLFQKHTNWCPGQTLCPQPVIPGLDPSDPTTNLHFPKRGAISSTARPNAMEASTSLRPKPLLLKKAPSIRDIREFPSLRAGNSSNGQQVRFREKKTSQLPNPSPPHTASTFETVNF